MYLYGQIIRWRLGGKIRSAVYTFWVLTKRDKISIIRVIMAVLEQSMEILGEARDKKRDLIPNPNPVFDSGKLRLS